MWIEEARTIPLHAASARAFGHSAIVSQAVRMELDAAAEGAYRPPDQQIPSESRANHHNRARLNSSMQRQHTAIRIVNFDENFEATCQTHRPHSILAASGRRQETFFERTSVNEVVHLTYTACELEIGNMHDRHP